MKHVVPFICTCDFQSTCRNVHVSLIICIIMFSCEYWHCTIKQFICRILFQVPCSLSYMYLYYSFSCISSFYYFIYHISSITCCGYYKFQLICMGLLFKRGKYTLYKGGHYSNTCAGQAPPCCYFLLASSTTSNLKLGSKPHFITASAISVLCYFGHMYATLHTHIVHFLINN